jgi:GxxExxY protein
MPIHCPATIASLSADGFEQLDYRVMGQAYACQNELGRLCDECAYQADLKARLLADGFRSVLTEVPVTVTHRDFSRKYYLDLVADDALYELKTDSALNGEHDAQLLNYMFLLGVPRAKLLNFRAGKVQGKIIATSLTQETRRRFTTVTERWRDLTPSCATLRHILCDLMQDWGAFLEAILYQDALVHFLGGATCADQPQGNPMDQPESCPDRIHDHQFKGRGMIGKGMKTRPCRFPIPLPFIPLPPAVYSPDYV